MKTAILASTFGPFSSNFIEALVKLKTPIDAIIMDCREVDSRSHDIWNERTGNQMPYKPIHQIIPAEIPVYYVDNHNSAACIKLVQEQTFDLLVNGGTPRIIKQSLIDAPKAGILNVHPGILPEYKGCTCVEWSIYNDDPVGITAHFMTAGIDDGPIICKETLDITKADTYQSIRLAIYHKTFELLDHVIRKIRNEDLKSSDLPPQGEEGHYYKPIPDDKHQQMLEKLNAGKYLYQK